MAGGSIRAAAKAAMVGGYRSAAAMRRAILPSCQSQPPHSSSDADGRRASTTIAMDDWVIPDREVFGPVPTHEEAMAATLDLNDLEVCVKQQEVEAQCGNLKRNTGILSSKSGINITNLWYNR